MIFKVLLSLTSLVLASEVELAKDICDTPLSKDDTKKIEENYRLHRELASSIQKEYFESRAKVQRVYNNVYKKNAQSEVNQQQILANMNKHLSNLQSEYESKQKEILQAVRRLGSTVKELDSKQKEICELKKKIGQGMGVAGARTNHERLVAQNHAADVKAQCEYFSETEKLVNKGKDALSTYDSKLKQTYSNLKRGIRSLHQENLRAIETYSQSRWIPEFVCSNCKTLKAEADKMWEYSKDSVVPGIIERIFGSEIPRSNAKREEISRIEQKVQQGKNRCVAVEETQKDRKLSSKKDWASEDERNKNFGVGDPLSSAEAKGKAESILNSESGVASALKSAKSNSDDAIRYQQAINETYKKIYGVSDSTPYLRQDGQIGRRTISATDRFLSNPSHQAIFMESLRAQGFIVK
jgi:hypothetical protein